MRPATRARALEIFKHALDLPGERRLDFVREQCRDDDELSRAVDQLFSADGSPDSLLDRRVGVSVADLAPQPAPTRIGRYEIVREIDSGGMGTVYEAWQDHPRRRVALKTLRGRLQTADGLRRFRFEAEVLGSLRHPAIAQVYESGTHLTERETPYIAMEFVPGARHLIDYVEEMQLDRRARIELFLQVADAVQHGHLSGVIHRDLKPSNLLVDESGAPKVIDFGLARASAPELEGLTLAETRPGQVLGTVQYMSPEQLSGDLERVDLRSDVHALGVVLFQLLAGEAPHDLRDLPLAQVARVVTEDEPRRLSAFDPQLRGDLEWIVAKALEKDPERRYASVSELAADLRRHLSHEPVLAGPPGGWYRARKFARRHRTALVVVAVFAAVTLASGVSIWKRTVLANTRLEIANEASGFLERMLSSVQPRYAMGEELTLREFVDQAAAELEQDPPSHPEVEASVRATLADTYAGIGRRDLALPHRLRTLELLRETLGAGHERTLASLNRYVVDMSQLGRVDEAEKLSETALDTATRALGSDHPEAIRALINHAQVLAELGERERAEEELRRALQLALESPRASPQLERDVRTTLVTFLGAQRHEEASAELQVAIASSPPTRGELDPEAISDEINQAGLLAAAGRTEEAVAAYADLIPRMERVLGATHPRSLAVRADQVKLLAKGGAPVDEELDALLAALAEVRGEEARAHLQAMRTTASSLELSGRYEESFELMVAAIEAVRRGSSQPTVEYFDVVHTFGAALLQTARYERAAEVLAPAAEEAVEVLGMEHAVTQQIRCLLASAWHPMGRSAEAGELLDSVLIENAAANGDDHPITLVALLNRGGICREAGETDRARELLTLAVERHERALGPWNPQTLAARHMLLNVRHELGEVDASDPALHEAVRSWRASRRGGDRAFVLATLELATVLSDVESWSEAEELYDHALEQREVLPPDVVIDIFLDRARLWIDQEDWPRAEAELGEAGLLIGGPRATPWRTHAVGRLRGIVALADPDRRDEALELLETSHNGFVQTLGAEHWRTVRCEEDVRRAFDGH